MSDFLTHIEQFLQHNAPNYQLAQGVGHAQAWEISERKLLIHAIPLEPAIKDWTPHTLLNYTTSAEANGYQVIHLWEDLWQQQPTVMTGRLLSTLGKTKRIHGRKTRVTRITLPQLRQFIQANHSHVSTQAKYKYGLWQGEILVGVASFSSMLTIHREEQPYQSSELIRFCTAIGVTVVGGLSKLLQAFLRDRAPQHLMTYADRDWSKGNSYEKLGFECVGATEPQLFWVDPITFIRYPDKRLTTPPLEHWLPIYNTGNWKYILWNLDK